MRTLLEILASINTFATGYFVYWTLRYRRTDNLFFLWLGALNFVGLGFLYFVIHRA